MTEIGAIISGINIFHRISEKVLSKKGTRLEKKIEAVGKLQRAINITRSFLVRENGKYAPNLELSDAWNDAFITMIPFDQELSKKLRNKGRFWSDPHSWLNEPGAMEIVPKLNELDEICEEMINTLELRISRR